MNTYLIDGLNLDNNTILDIINNPNVRIEIKDEIIPNLTNIIDDISCENISYSNEEVRAILIVYINSLLNQNVDYKTIMKYLDLLNSNNNTIVVNNPTIIACAKGIILIKESYETLKKSNAIIATSLDGFNGNTSPFIEDAYTYRPYQTNLEVAKEIINLLEGSSIFVHDVNKAVQDPLSFRDAAHINGAWLDCTNYLTSLLLLQINSANDYTCDNWILAVEELGNSIAHSSKFSCYRTLKLCNPEFTKLPRFLAYNDSVLGFATLQKVYCALDSEIRHLANPVMLNNDLDSIYCVDKTLKIIDNLKYIIGIELMHASQAIDLRVDHYLGKGVEKVYKKYRDLVEMYKIDRIISNDIEKSYQFIVSDALIK